MAFRVRIGRVDETKDSVDDPLALVKKHFAQRAPRLSAARPILLTRDEAQRRRSDLASYLGRTSPLSFARSYHAMICGRIRSALSNGPASIPVP